MNYKDKIMYKAALRGIDFCVHFTNVTNLPSILQYGILPKKTMDEERIEYNHLHPLITECSTNIEQKIRKKGGLYW